MLTYKKYLMMDSPIDCLAFADEFGTNSFNFKEGTHFIVSAVIFERKNMSTIAEGIANIRKKHKFQTGEIKSSKVGSNHTRRIAVLRDIVNLDISIFAVVVNKQELSGEGFNFKKSFYKFLNNLLYKELYRTYPRLELHVDEMGANDYMREFKKYVNKHHPPTLFYRSEFSISDSKNDIYIQLADFIVGTLGYIYDETKKSESSQEFLNILEPNISKIEAFPKRFGYTEFKDIEDENLYYDPEIAKLCYLRVTKFLDDKFTSDSQLRQDQTQFLNLLLLLQGINHKNKFILTKDILYYLNEGRSKKLNEEYFRTKVIGGLRDQGILIASSNAGYKIPTCASDLNKFVNHGKRIILPMLSRIENARDIVKMATLDAVDILDRNEFRELKEIIDSNKSIKKGLR